MTLDAFDYHLPEELIAQEPLADRAGSRLLVLEKGSGRVRHQAFRDVVELLRPGDTLVMNDTRVTALRLMGHKTTGAEVEALLLNDAPEPFAFVALMRPGKRLQPGSRVEFAEGLVATVLNDLGEGRKTLQFDPAPDFHEKLKTFGKVPLPPYIGKELHEPERYQTVYAQTGGSSAAPTAGLHFTQEILAALAEKGVDLAWVTLDVGLDTFRPVQVDNIADHKMHGERCAISEETAEKVNGSKGRVIAVGTTSVRTLETHAVGRKRVLAGEKISELFIYPGYEWKVVDAMFTNFHMPKTTMLLMLSALTGGEALMAAYAEAVRERYRFLSFGDSMFIE